MQEEQQVETPAWVSADFGKMLATNADLKKGEGWVFLRDGIVSLRLEGAFTVTPRGMSLPTPDGESHRTDPSTPWDRISSYADIRQGKQELYVMARAGVVCIQLTCDGLGGKAAFGGGILVRQRQSARYPGITEFDFDKQG